MRIFINQKLFSDISALLEDQSVKEAVDIWGFIGLHEKSSIDLKMFSTPFGSISLLYGPRQIGKTASLKLFLHQLVDSDTIIYTDCSTILHKTDLYQHLLELIQERTTIVLDEVQSIEGWYLALRSLYSEGKLKDCRVWCTGSEARHLLESGERLPGRRGEGRIIFARPWSFREYMEFFYNEMVIPYKSEVDFYFDKCAFELKSNGHPTKKQFEILKEAPQYFIVRKESIPLVAYLIGEGRD